MTIHSQQHQGEHGSQSTFANAKGLQDAAVDWVIINRLDAVHCLADDSANHTRDSGWV